MLGDASREPCPHCAGGPACGDSFGKRRVSDATAPDVMEVTKLAIQDAHHDCGAADRVRPRPTKVLHSRMAKRIPGAIPHFERRSLERTVLQRIERSLRLSGAVARHSIESTKGISSRRSTA